MKQTITPAERLQLIGLVALADNYAEKQEEILAAAYSLLGTKEVAGGSPEDPSGHIADVVFNGYDVDELLTRLGVAVEEPEELES